MWLLICLHSGVLSFSSSLLPSLSLSLFTAFLTHTHTIQTHRIEIWEPLLTFSSQPPASLPCVHTIIRTQEELFELIALCSRPTCNLSPLSWGPGSMCKSPLQPLASSLCFSLQPGLLPYHATFSCLPLLEDSSWVPLPSSERGWVRLLSASCTPNLFSLVCGYLDPNLAKGLWCVKFSILSSTPLFPRTCSDVTWSDDVLDFSVHFHSPWNTSSTVFVSLVSLVSPPVLWGTQG